MDKHIEEGRLLLFKNKEKVFKNYFFEYAIILIVLSVAEGVISFFFTKSFSWWEIPFDIALCVVIALASAWLQVRWNRRREKENAYFKEKYGKK
jgi:membrane protein implicated in regulation of membrane protease activity